VFLLIMLPIDIVLKRLFQRVFPACAFGKVPNAVAIDSESESISLVHHEVESEMLDFIVESIEKRTWRLPLEVFS